MSKLRKKPWNQSGESTWQYRVYLFGRFARHVSNRRLKTACGKSRGAGRVERAALRVLGAHRYDRGY